MKIQFNSNHKVVASVKPTYSIEELEGEQGVYSATPEFVRKHCGPITNSILDKVPQEYFKEAKARNLYPNIDVRVHRLYVGNYPAYPGWHCDAQYRETYFGQPDPTQTKLSNHLICTVSSYKDGVSNTVFLDKDVELDFGEYFTASLNWKEVDEAFRSITPQIHIMKDGDLTTFDCWTLHKCMPAAVRGWRLFFRMAMWYRPNLGEGKLSKQEMIYLDLSKASGW